MPLLTDNVLPDVELHARNAVLDAGIAAMRYYCLLYTSPSPRD